MIAALKKSTPREWWLAISISCSAGFTLCGYEFLRSASTVLFKTAYGAQNLPIVMALMPISVILILYIYGRLLSLLGPRRTLFWTTVGSGLIIGICYMAIQSGSAIATALLYLYREAYIVLLIEQYWSLINSTLETTSAKKLNGPITGMSSFGAILGGFLVYKLAQPLGTSSMLLFSAALLIPAAILSDLGYLKCGEPLPTPQEAGGKRGHLGLRLFRSSPLLMLLLLIVMTTQIVSAVLGLSFQTILQDVMPNMDQQTAYQGQFFAMINGAAAFLQFVIAPILLSLLPVGLIHLGIPLIHMLTIGALLIHPSLQTTATAYFLFKAIDYSIFRATKETLYIPLSFDARYRAKEIIDCFGYRFSKGGSSLVIAIVQRLGVVVGSFYGWIALGAAVAWMMLIVPIIQHLPGRQKQEAAEEVAVIS